MDCICGHKKYIIVEKPHYKVTKEGNTEPAGENLRLAQCVKCKVIRQIDISFDTIEKYNDYYKTKYPPVNKSYTKKNWEHDKEVARKRCDEYNIQMEAFVLDVGCGSGAFVDECRSRGQVAYGCDIGKYSYTENDNFIYHQRFEDINFPTDYFDWVACHDVLEHSLDPKKMLSEIFRILKQGGNCVIDLPRFFHESGKHHWKDIEHIWFFEDKQLIKILEEIGFSIEKIKHPINSKSVFYCSKPTQIRPNILVPPGIGDSYWSIVKLQSFLKKENLSLPDISIVCNKEKRFQGHLRSVPFLQLFPFLNATGNSIDNTAGNKVIWKEAYAEEGRTIFKDILGYNYFISYNGHLRVGKRLEEIDPELECNWFPSMFKSLEQYQYEERCKNLYGKYIVYYFPMYGTYSYWTKQFPARELVKAICSITRKTGYTPVFVGAKWDAENTATYNVVSDIKRKLPEAIDLSGKTSLSQLFGVLNGSEAVVGYPSGLTIMSTVLKNKTLIIWNDYYNKDFSWFSCPPETRGKNYFIDYTYGLTAIKLTKEVISLVKDGFIKGMGNDYVPKIYEKKNIQRNVKLNKEQKPKIKRLNESTTILCILKSGGHFTIDYVKRLKNMIERNTTSNYKFLCLSDLKIDFCESKELEHDYPGYWSKIELFKLNITDTKRIIYFDLDTVIVNNIDQIFKVNSDFAALQPWNPYNRNAGMCASGLMTWSNEKDYSYIYNNFNIEEIEKYPRGDQQFVSKMLMDHGDKFEILQNLMPGIFSYKRQCKRNGHYPSNARIICFHGKPRITQLMNVKWIKENWI